MSGARILIPELSTGRDFFSEENGPTSVLDLSIYPLLIEEMIGYGVSEFAVLRGAGIEGFVPRIPLPFQKRVKLIDVSSVAGEVARVFQPLEAELDLKLIFPPLPSRGCWAETPNGQPPSAEIDHILAIAGELYPAVFRLLIGMKDSLHVEMDLPRLRELVDLMLSSVRSINARTTFAQLRGVLGSYSAHELDSVQFNSSASREFVNLFEELLQESAYIDLSRQSHAMGYPQRIGTAIKSFGRSSRSLLKHARIRGAL